LNISAFFTNAGDMIKAKTAIRKMYADAVTKNTVKATLDLLRERGLPKELYDQYLEEAIEKGIIPIAGKSKVGGRLMTEQDILKAEDILEDIPPDFWKHDKGFYGIG